MALNDLPAVDFDDAIVAATDVNAIGSIALWRAPRLSS